MFNRGTTLQQVRKGVYKKVYSADYAQTVYQNNRKRSVKKLILTKEIKEKILHYHKQKFLPEMMVKKNKFQWVFQLFTIGFTMDT